MELDWSDLMSEMDFSEERTLEKRAYVMIWLSVKKIQLKFEFLDMSCCSKENIIVEVEKPDTAKVFELLEAIAKHPAIAFVGPYGGGSGRLRLLQIYQRRIMNIVPGQALVASLLRVPEGTVHRVEEIPEDQLPEKYDPKKELLISCMHAGPNGLAAIGRPFLMKVHDGEEMIKIATRMKEKLEIQDDVFKKWRVVIIVGKELAFTIERMDIEAVKQIHGEGGWTPRIAIGLIHGLKMPPKPRSLPASGDQEDESEEDEPMEKDPLGDSDCDP